MVGEKKARVRAPGPGDGEEMRLPRYLARCGVCSRREAEVFISAGRIAVNGTPVHHPGTRVEAGLDRVTVDGLEVTPRALEYVLVHKPVGVLCTRSDPRGRPTIYSALPQKCEHLTYAGRLDYLTSGVLLLTNDGALIYRLTRPEYGVEKVYEARVRGRVDEKRLHRLTRGIKVDDETLCAVRVRVAESRGDRSRVEITLTEGKYREVRRMLQFLDLEVEGLCRTRCASLTLGELAPGHWRPLLRGEVDELYALCSMKQRGCPC